MSVGATQCLKRYGEETLITALQCVTHTANNQPRALSARLIKALRDVLDSDKELHDGRLGLLEAFDAIDLMALQSAVAVAAAVKKISLVQAIAERIPLELSRRLPCKAVPHPCRHRAFQ
jgi:hypothetical protein